MIPRADRFRGCLLGHAVGDALGAPFEGLWADAIPPDLLADFAEYEGYRRGQWTDDTQLTLATVEAILDSNDVAPGPIAAAIARLWQRNEVIGPGGACTAAAWSILRGVPWDRAGAPIGQAGNGTAMRTGFLGLLLPVADIARDVASISRITHQDPRSIAGGIAIAAAAAAFGREGPIDRATVCATIADSMRAHDAAFADLVLDLPRLLAAPREDAVLEIAWAGQPRPELPRPIITPFVVPTVLACLWSSLRHPESWDAGVAEVIGLGGDVDTTGAIVGGILGARLGEAAIPAHLRSAVVDGERIRDLATRLADLVPA